MEVEIDTLLQCGLGELVAGFWRDARGKGIGGCQHAPLFLASTGLREFH
jgi:hypothetical protein